MSETGNKLNTHYTIILGAEGQLGQALAREVARKGCNLILISTTHVDLQRFAIVLQLKEEVQVEAIKLDLANRKSIEALTKELSQKYTVRALVNNITCDWSAGQNKFSSDLASKEFLTQFRGAALFTRILLPQMSRLSTSYIQQIIPFPFKRDQFSPEAQKTVSKVNAFSRELEDELKDTGVSVSMVYIAPINNKLQKKELTDGTFEEELYKLTTGIIAIKAVNGMLRGDRIIIPGFWNRVQFFIYRHALAWLRSTDESLGSSLQPSL